MELIGYQFTGIYPVEGQNWNLWIVGYLGYNRCDIIFPIISILSFLVIMDGF
jgi:hypothetical protein